MKIKKQKLAHSKTETSLKSKVSVLKDYTPKVVALTGTSGFKGLHLLGLLEKDARVKKIIALDRKKPALTTKKTLFFRTELTQPTTDQKIAAILKKQKVDVFVHSALPITPPRRLELAHEIISIGTMYVLNACKAVGVKKFILPTTTDVYGAHPSNPHFLEEDLHPPKGYRHSRFLGDKIDAEKQALRFAKSSPQTIVTILRPCSILGPSVQSYKTRYLKRWLAMTVLGFDPLMQFVHEDDLFRALKLAIFEDHPGIFNIVGRGILPLSRVIHLSNQFHLRLPQIGFKSLVQALWTLDLSPAPSSHVDFLRYSYLADATKAAERMGFVAKYSSKEALLSFVGAKRLEDFEFKTKA